MKKLAIFIFASLCCGAACAQTLNISGVVSSFETRFAAWSLNNRSEFKAAEFEVAPGYGFNRHLSVYIPVTATVGLIDKDGSKSYDTAGQLGLALGYSPLHDKRQQLEILAKAGSTLGGKWEYLYYDAGLRYGWGAGAVCAMYIGAGIRYYDAYGGAFRDYCNVYFSVGFRVNFYKNK